MAEKISFQAYHAKTPSPVAVCIVVDDQPVGYIFHTTSITGRCMGYAAYTFADKRLVDAQGRQITGDSYAEITRALDRHFTGAF